MEQTAVNFGLINQTYSTDTSCGKALSQWQRFEVYVNSLNARSGRDVVYKVLFMGRHGQGYHNAAETYYGTPAWNVLIPLCSFITNGANMFLPVLLFRAGWKRNSDMGRCSSHTNWNRTSPGCSCLLALPNRYSEDPVPSILLHVSSVPLPGDCKHNIFFSAATSG